MLREYSDLSKEEIDAIQEDFLQGRSGAAVFGSGSTNYYLVYEPVNFDNWIVLGIVPTNVVNASMNTLQYSTLLVVAGAAIALITALTVFFIRRYRRSLSRKDTEILYRENLFSTLSSNVDDIFAMLDSDTLRVDYISPNVEKLVGIPERTVRNNIRVVDSLVKNTENGLILDRLPTIMPGEQAEWDREYIHQQTGESRWFHATALCREIGEAKKYILVLSDRTRDKKINQELEDAVNMARNANKAKSTFLSNMSHDIRTPMNAIIGFATLALSNIDNPEKAKDHLTKILSSGNHLLSLINDILDMSRIESGKIQLDETENNLSEMLHDIRTIIGGQIHAKHLELYMDVIDVNDEDIYCDKTRINQVLLNLMSNAIKFTAPGGTISLRMIQIHKAPPGHGLYEIRVKDTGIGMSPEFAEHIFEPFERERTSTVSKIQGTGLGMAISKNIIDMMDGSIEVYTEQGKGTEFVIRLTLRLQTEHGCAENIKELEGLKVLIADDDFNTCDSVTKMLTQMGMRSEWTLFGKEAVLRTRHSFELSDPFNAYIIDWRLPDMNGIEVSRQIRSLDDDAPIIIITAYDRTDIEAEAKAAGVTAFCAKPIFMSDLRKALLNTLSQQNLKEEAVLPVTDTTKGFKGKKLLLVEDNELNREIAYEILSEYGFLIDTAENGSEALENTALSSVPIVAMTANAFDENLKAAADCGMNGFVSKPINMQEIIKALQGVFGII